ncbi:unnamed protein product [Leptidea sinapis]|uniref:SAYSvFN domain-containing protein n=1 Tax=Leptidea sinapis TaxID=189913 RepID=A0A5E4QVL4_9NEOP|nr:unnamed protein product [Leptidea sinapis]
MEAKLREYRALRRRKELIENVKQKLEKAKDKFVDFLLPETNMDRKEDEIVLLEDDSTHIGKSELQLEDTTEGIEESEVPPTEENQETWKYFLVKWSIYSIIWLTLFIYFIKLQFGAVFFVISALVGICLNTRTRPKKKGEISAYSVFNENCESIGGTLNAEQLQKEMMFGFGGVNIL